MLTSRIAAAVAALLVSGCLVPTRPPGVAPASGAASPVMPGATPTLPEPGRGTSIVVCGERVDIGTPVVLWFEEGGYSAYSTRAHFADAPEDAPVGLRYTPGRPVDDAALAARLRSPDATPADLAEAVDLFVLHYDVCGTSEVCFRVLQDQRGLSVHFLLDLDGTLYQTLDLRERAWHAAKANTRSVGVEVAQIGAWPPLTDAARAGLGLAADDADPRHPRLREWYAEGAAADGGTAVTLPERFGDGGLRTPERAAAPATDALVAGAVHGRELLQYDFTAAQYEALAHLAAGLHGVLPRIELEAPRDAGGAVRQDLLTDEEYARWSGLVGHHHLSLQKTDPGPALRWDALLERARALAAE